MLYYVICVKTGSEEKYIKIVEKQLNLTDGRIIWPRRSLLIRRKGKQVESIAPLFPGYLFLETLKLKDNIKKVLKEVPCFIKFLKNNKDVIPLRHAEKDLLLELLSYGEIMKRSLVDFDYQNRIRVIDGPLRNLEGRIKKVDKRKSRAKVLFNLHGKSLLVDIGFDVIKTV